MHFGRFTLDVSSRQLTRDDAPVHLTPKAFDLLVLLSSEAPNVVSKATLHERLWPGTYVTDATLVGLVKEVRRALGDHDRSAPLIRTAHRIGYAFSPPRPPDAVERRSAPRHWLVFNDRRVVLGEGENLIGRDPGAQVWLDAPGVSRQHARIVIDAAGVRVEDLGSKNGTTVSEVLVRGSVGLEDGERIAFGPVCAVYRAPAGATTTLSRARARSESDG